MGHPSQNLLAEGRFRRTLVNVRTRAPGWAVILLFVGGMTAAEITAPALPVSEATCLRFRVAPGLEGSVRDRNALPETETPIAGFLAHVAMVLSDERAFDDLDWVAYPEYFGMTGTPLAADPARDWAPVLLDSGAGTDLLGYADRIAMGLTGDYLTENPFAASGVCGGIDLLTSLPIGVFVTGLQAVRPDGTIDTTTVVGHSNFALGANTLDNHQAGLEVPSVVGTPLFVEHVVVVRNSQPTVLEHDGTTLCSPAVEFFIDGSEINPLEYAHRFTLQVLPGGDTGVSYFGFPDLGTGEFFPFIPSTVGLASALLFTGGNVTVTEGAKSSSDVFVVDTGAQATLINETIAINLGLDTDFPEFEVEVQGFGCTIQAPGFVIDSLTIPATGGDLHFTQVPVIVINIASPAGGTVPGILGTNLFYDRDVAYVGNEVPPPTGPYVRVSAPLDRLRFTGATATAEEVALGWVSLPALAESDVVLQGADVPDAGTWTNLATNGMGVCRGTFEAPIGEAARKFYRGYLP